MHFARVNQEVSIIAMTVMIMSAIQRKPMCDSDSVYCGPRAKYTISMKPEAGRLPRK